MRIDRATRLAAAFTLAAAAPVHVLLVGLVLGVQLLQNAPHAEPVAALPPVATRGAPKPEPAGPQPAAPPMQPAPVAQVVGALRTEDGTPVPGEAVELESAALAASYVGTSDVRGRFLVSNVAPASDYEVRVLTDGRYRDYAERGVAVMAEGLALDIVLEPLASARLAGRMVDAEGNPIPRRSLLVRASHAPGLVLEVTGDERGNFWVDDAPTGQLTFSTRTIPNVKIHGPLLAPGAEADLRLVLDDGSHELGGRVVGARDVPVAGAQLKLSWSYKHGGPLSSCARTAVTDSNGRFRFSELGPGTHRLAVRADGYADAIESYDVFWNSGDVELRLDPTF